MTDLVDYMRAVDEERCNVEPWTVAQRCADAAAEIERLRAEVQTWVNHTKTAVWSDSEECRLLAADNERLRAALRPFADVARDWPDADPDVECGVGAMFVADGKAKIYFRDFHAARAALKEEK